MTLAPDVDIDTFTPKPKRARRTFSYYDFGPILSHNAEFNFVVGGRGLGKTYGAKKRAIKRAIERGEEFIYLRRYEKERTKSRDTFFADLIANEEFPEWDFRSNGNYFEMTSAATRGDKKREWTRIGYAMVLSTAQQDKSVAFPNVTTIIFDEFIIEKGAIRYLPNETVVFNNLYSTVDRWQDKTKVFFLANAVSIGNPYFITYGILPDADTTFLKLDYGKAKGFIAADFPDADEFASEVKKTRFGQFIDGSDYEEFAIMNKFHDNTKALLGVKDPKALLYFNFQTDTQTVAVWYNEMSQTFYVHEKVPPGQRTVTMNVGYLDGKKILMLPREPIMKRLMSALRHDRMKFENPMIRELWIQEVAMKCL